MTSTILTTAQAHPNNILRSDGGRAAEPNIFLAGGRDIPDDQRMHQIETLADRVKLNVENRYEHFESTSEVRDVEGRSLRVYKWIYRTYVAE
ncbi:DUF5988 family protein [Streptomyces sp. NPDC049936]|uniref:DUF5988 family protein n=1 Tax=Streptomyces sp. NPDC049936 TaxID=3365599 RepID=UPI000FDC4956|nr:DUF5988 family protein [Streptomyces sp. S10(2018)]